MSVFSAFGKVREGLPAHTRDVIQRTHTIEKSDFHTLSKTASKQLFLFMISSLFGPRRPGVWTNNIRFLNAVRKSLKTAISIYDFVTFWSQATFEAYMRIGSHRQCTYPSPYNVWQTLHTYVWTHLIQCTYAATYDVRTKKSRNVRLFLEKKGRKNGRRNSERSL